MMYTWSWWSPLPVSASIATTNARRITTPWLERSG
jgi:hypothetical protein